VKNSYYLVNQLLSFQPCYTIYLIKIIYKQGQYLAFIYCYAKINDIPPAEHDMQKYFRVTAPTIHKMIRTVEQKGLISRVLGQARSITLLVQKKDIPQLD
jgi:DNA-binding MarR family transcriptional regulator